MQRDVGKATSRTRPIPSKKTMWCTRAPHKTTQSRTRPYKVNLALKRSRKARTRHFTRRKSCAHKAGLVRTKVCANLVRKPCARGLCGALCGGFVRWAFAKLGMEGEWVWWLGGPGGGRRGGGRAGGWREQGVDLRIWPTPSPELVCAPLCARFVRTLCDVFGT